MGGILRPGLRWSSGLFDVTPIWEKEPSVDAIRRVCCQQLEVHDGRSCTVSFLAAGAYNKVYTVSLEDGRMLIMRVSLPVDPRNKTRGEVATLRTIRRSTKVPVPEVIAYSDSSANEIGFEWILMEFMPGRPVYYQWRKMSMAQKVDLVEQVADYQAQILSLDDSGTPVAFRGIGTLGTGNQSKQALLSDNVEPGPMTSQLFFIDGHFDYDVSHGPFSCSHDWLRAYLDVIIEAQVTAIRNAEDEDDREDAEDDLRVTRRLEELLPLLFMDTCHPSHKGSPERTVIWHDDLNFHNIMVSPDGKITALIDWECVSTMPLWVAGQPPRFLCGPDREVEPDRDTYGDASEDGTAGEDKGDGLDSEGKSSLYWIHRREYEQTQLRKVYGARMAQVWPEWARQREEFIKADFVDALSTVASGFVPKLLPKWVDAIKRGEKIRLMEVLNPPFE